MSDFSTRRWLLASAIFIFHFVRFSWPSSRGRLHVVCERRRSKEIFTVCQIFVRLHLLRRRGAAVIRDDGGWVVGGGWCSRVTGEIITNGTGVLNNFVLDIGAKKPGLSYFVDATRRCFLIPFTPEIEVLFTRSLTNFHEYSSRRRTSSAPGLYISDRDRTSTRAQPRRKTYRGDLNSFGCS